MSLNPRHCDVKMRGRKERPGKRLRKVRYHLGTVAAKTIGNPKRGHPSQLMGTASPSGHMWTKRERNLQLLRESRHIWHRMPGLCRQRCMWSRPSSEAHQRQNCLPPYTLTRASIMMEARCSASNPVVIWMLDRTGFDYLLLGIGH